MPAGGSLSIAAFVTTLDEVRLPVGLTVRSIRLNGAGLDISTDPVTLSLPSPARFEAEVDEAGVQAFLNQKAPGGLKNFVVKIVDGEIRVEAVLKVLIELKASAVCRLAIVGGQRLMVELQSAEMLSVGAKTLIQSQIDNVNPIFDVAQLPLPVTLETVEAVDGAIKLTGTVSPPEHSA